MLHFHPVKIKISLLVFPFTWVFLLPSSMILLIGKCNIHVNVILTYWAILSCTVDEPYSQTSWDIVQEEYKILFAEVFMSRWLYLGMSICGLIYTWSGQNLWQITVRLYGTLLRRSIKFCLLRYSYLGISTCDLIYTWQSQSL